MDRGKGMLGMLEGKGKGRKGREGDHTASISKPLYALAHSIRNNNFLPVIKLHVRKKITRSIMTADVRSVSGS